MTSPFCLLGLLGVLGVLGVLGEISKRHTDLLVRVEHPSRMSRTLPEAA